MTEIFKRHKSGYFISNRGRIKGIRVEFLSPTVSAEGYLVTSLPNNGKRTYYLVHRAVYETFNGEIPEGKVINHIDGDKQNNWVSNLECVTAKENTQHAYRTGLAKGKAGEDNSMAKLSAAEFLLVCEALMEGSTNAEIAEMVDLAPKYVSLIRHKRRWKTLFPSWYKPTKSLGNTGIALDQMTLIYQDTLTDMKNSEIADKWGLDRSTVSRIRNRLTWVDFINYYESCSATTISGG